MVKDIVEKIIEGKVCMEILECRKVDANLNTTDKFKFLIYLYCGGLKRCLGDVNNKEELMNLVGPIRLVDTLKVNLNSDELEVILSSLKKNNYYYYIGDEKYKAIYCVCSECKADLIETGVELVETTKCYYYDKSDKFVKSEPLEITTEYKCPECGAYVDDLINFSDEENEEEL